VLHSLCRDLPRLTNIVSTESLKTGCSFSGRLYYPIPYSVGSLSDLGAVIANWSDEETLPLKLNRHPLPFY